MLGGADSNMNKFILAIGRRVNRLLYPFGYKMTTVGYLNARDLVRLAGGRGEKLTAYKEREYAELDPRCKGRLDRITGRIESHVQGMAGLRYLEVGTGTGRYMEKFLKNPSCNAYEVYEVDWQWRDYLSKTYSADRRVIIKECDGRTLSPTSSASCDVVTANGVLVYQKHCINLSYMDEMYRVCKKGGIIAFDVLLSSKISLDDLREFTRREMLFPVLSPDDMLEVWIKEKGLQLEDKFDDALQPYITSTYYVLRKMGN